MKTSAEMQLMIDEVRANLDRIEDEFNGRPFKFRYRSSDGRFKVADEAKDEPWLILFKHDPDDVMSKRLDISELNIAQLAAFSSGVAGFISEYERHALTVTEHLDSVRRELPEVHFNLTEGAR